VPRDVSVLGIDNIAVSALNRIGLTTIEIYNASSDEKNLGMLAAKILLQAIDNGDGTSAESIVLKPRLVERQSCREYSL
jgi:DNA-binding LacI/PurR family transcriptional regulator